MGWIHSGGPVVGLGPAGRVGWMRSSLVGSGGGPRKLNINFAKPVSGGENGPRVQMGAKHAIDSSSILVVNEMVDELIC